LSKGEKGKEEIGFFFFLLSDEWLSREVLLLIIIIIIDFVCAGAGGFVLVFRSPIYFLFY
jgi:hypothetical protein